MYAIAEPAHMAVGTEEYAHAKTRMTKGDVDKHIIPIKN
jgi:hypothetical protein